MIDGDLKFGYIAIKLRKNTMSQLEIWIGGCLKRGFYVCWTGDLIYALSAALAQCEELACLIFTPKNKSSFNSSYGFFYSSWFTGRPVASRCNHFEVCNAAWHSKFDDLSVSGPLQAFSRCGPPQLRLTYRYSLANPSAFRHGTSVTNLHPLSQLVVLAELSGIEVSGALS